jgi:dipeptide transport system substrate-binding protein
MRKTLTMSLLLSSLLFSCSGKKKSSNNFVYCSEGSPTAFNPQITTDGTSNNAAAHTIYEKLVDFKYGTIKVNSKPLASSMQMMFFFPSTVCV